MVLRILTPPDKSDVVLPNPACNGIPWWCIDRGKYVCTCMQLLGNASSNCIENSRHISRILQTNNNFWQPTPRGIPVLIFSWAENISPTFSLVFEFWPWTPHELTVRLIGWERVVGRRVVFHPLEEQNNIRNLWLSAWFEASLFRVKSNSQKSNYFSRVEVFGEGASSTSMCHPHPSTPTPKILQGFPNLVSFCSPLKSAVGRSEVWEVDISRSTEQQYCLNSSNFRLHLLSVQCHNVNTNFVCFSFHLLEFQVTMA